MGRLLKSLFNDSTQRSGVRSSRDSIQHMLVNPRKILKGMEVCLLPMPTFVWIIILLILAVVGFASGTLYRKKVAEREISSAEDEAKRIINEAIKNAESKKREALVEAKEEIHKSRSEFEREEKLRRSEVQKQERRLQQKEEALDRKTDALEKKNETLSSKIAAVEAQQAEVALVKKSQLEMLEKISGFSVDEAKAYLIENIKNDVTHEMAMKVKEVEAQYKEFPSSPSPTTK